GTFKVFLLAGQSNMEGHAVVDLDHPDHYNGGRGNLERTLDSNPDFARRFEGLRDEQGEWTTRDDVWCWYRPWKGPLKAGPLSIGFAVYEGDHHFGPELGIGRVLGDSIEAPVLLIKTAWGGKSLQVDFRPPSREGATGPFYERMLKEYREGLADARRKFPGLEGLEPELAGFFWFQGWNDMVDSGTYPTRGQPGSYDAYSKNLAHFIRDVRRDLKAPKLPFVIGVMGAGGPIAKYSPDQMRYAGIHGEFRKAMAAPTKLPEFKGNVTAVFTENYWDGQLSELVDRRGKINAKRRELAKDQSLTRAQRDKAIAEFTDEIFTREEQAILEAGVSNAAYHYLGSAKILTQIGQAFAEALVAME
ncbi:MAG: sialate O-acetylesterase, partial [Verrucomicrobiota bacterium]|nr:sialate O-acetylesterase [Verrucomicrobiota bacterium]